MKTRKLFWVEVVCVNCSKTGGGRFSDGVIKVKEVTKLAAREGFRFVKNNDEDSFEGWDWKCRDCGGWK